MARNLARIQFTAMAVVPPTNGIIRGWPPNTVGPGEQALPQQCQRIAQDCP